MKALRFDGALHLDDVPPPEPAPGEALVRVRMAGICNTDLEIVRGYMGFRGTLGHEFVGEVLDAPDRALVGRRVCGEINAGCGTCAACLAGMSRHCPSRTVLGIVGRDGAFAERLRLPEGNLVTVPDAVSDEAAIFVEPLAAALGILEQVAIRPADRVVVLGDGKLGLLCAMVLAQTGAELTLVGRHEAKMARVAGHGVTTSLAAPPDASADVVVECTGRPEGLAAALAAVRPRGTVVLKSTYASSPVVDTARIVIHELRIVGSRCGLFAPALRLLAEKRVDPTVLLDARYPLAEGEAAMRRAADRGVLKVALDVA